MRADRSAVRSIAYVGETVSVSVGAVLEGKLGDQACYSCRTIAAEYVVGSTGVTARRRLHRGSATISFAAACAGRGDTII